MRKVNLKGKIIGIFLIAVAILFTLSYSKNSLAQHNNIGEHIDFQVEKVDRDTVKLSLDGFAPVAKAFQLSFKIDGNAKFNEESIKWLVDSEYKDVKTNIKFSEDKKSVELFIVSTGAIDKDGGDVDLLEIDVEKTGDGSSIFKIIPNENENGIAYSYIENATNKQVKGNNINNINNKNLTINSAPIITLVKSENIIEDKIILNKGDIFNALDYVKASDDEDGEVTNITSEHSVDTDLVGSYSIVYKAVDSEGDESVLNTSVIVENINMNNVAAPKITVSNKVITTNIGEEVDLLDGVKASDYAGRSINVDVSGDYDINNAGTYTIKYNATDRLGNKAKEEEATLIVEIPKLPGGSEQPDNSGQTGSPSNPSNPGNPSGPSDPGNTGDQHKPVNPEQSEKPSKPGDTNKPENSEEIKNPSNIEDTEKHEYENNKNEDNLPQTGQGVYFGFIIIAAIGIIIVGISLLCKKTK